MPLHNISKGITVQDMIHDYITSGGNDIDVVFRNSGAGVIIGGLKFPLRDRGYGKGYHELADETGAILIPDIFEGIMGNRNMMSDPIHPNGAGYTRIAQRFYKAMVP